MLMSLLLWFGVPMLLGIVGIALCVRETWTDPPFGVVLCAISIVLLVTVSIAVPCERLDAAVGCAEFRSTQQSVEVARANVDLAGLERAALQHKIVEANAWLAREQLKAGVWLLKCMYPNEIYELRPIE